MGATLHRHIEVSFMKSGFVLNGFPSELGNPIKDGSFIQPGSGFR